MKHLVATAILALTALVAHGAQDIHKTNGNTVVESNSTVGNVTTTNGRIRLDARVTARDVASTNGGVTIGADSRVEQVKTTNGNISLEQGVNAHSVTSTNGSIAIGQNAQIARNIETTNGSITLEREVHVHGHVRTTNGSITLETARVDGRLSTTNGDIEVGANSHIGQGIFIGKSGKNFFNQHRVPRVVIGPNAVVGGPLIFEREVKLYVSESATIGPVSGATPIRFSGNRP